MRPSDRIRAVFRRFLRTERSSPPLGRGPAIHVIILDGTLSSLEDGRETNAGRIYKLLVEARASGARLNLHYEAGIQWPDWRSTRAVIEGRGINRQIRRAYGFLASRYRPGDRIFLIGYSRGAYAVRSLAGCIDRVGLLRSHHATVRAIRQAYRHYELSPGSVAAERFAAKFCHEAVEIEMIGVFDTVKALGLRVPLLWQLTEPRHAFHSHALGRRVKHGYHALALDERREAFAPVLWDAPEGFGGRVEQVWFRGTHGDIGGQLGGYDPARGLANVALTWMLGRAEAAGLPLPGDWRGRIAADGTAPSMGAWRGWGRLFLLRRARRPGHDASERVHRSADGHRLATGLEVAE